MANNQYKAFGAGDGAFTLTPDAYAAITALQQGFQNGVADAQEFNTLARQVSTVAAMIGQFIADKANLDAEDNGNVAELEARFIAALIAVIREVGGPNAIHFGDNDTGTANAIVMDLSPVITAYTKPCVVLFKKGLNDNTGDVTANFNSVGAVSLRDQSGANFASAALKGSTFYIGLFDGGNFRILGGSTSYTNVTGLTANGGKMVDFNGTTGVIDLHIGKGTHDPNPADADMWPRQKASNNDQVFMTSAELMTWIDAHIPPPTIPDPTGTDIGSCMKVPATWLYGQADVPINATVTGDKFLTGFTLGLNTMNFWPLVSPTMSIAGLYGGSGPVPNSWFDARRSALNSSQTWQLKNVQVMDPGTISGAGGGSAGVTTVLCEFKRTA